MLSISQALQRLKANVADVVPERLIRSICDDLHLRGRQRSLTPVVTTYLFLQQVLHGNTACSHLRHLGKLDVTDSAYCQARQRLPVAFFHRLQRAATGACRHAEPAADAARWHGHRVYLLDGSSFSMPDTPELQEEFGQPGGQAAGCGFPTAHLLTLFDAHAGFLLKAVPAPLRTHDLSRAALMHPELRPGDIVLGDRAFCSYAHLALCRQRQLHGLFRAHQRLVVDFRPHRRHAPVRGAAPDQAGRPRSRWLKRLGRHDQLVEYAKPKERPAWMTAAAYAALPETLVVRELRFPVRTPGRRTRVITLVTTLLDPRRYSARALAKLYGQRWQVEVDLRHLKQTLGMDVLHCQTFPGVVKELLLFVLVYNLVRRVMQQAARRQRVSPERVSFVDALRWLRQARPGEEVPRLRVNPARPGRAEPRVRKRRPKQFPVMKRPREQLRQALFTQRPAA